MFLITIIEIIIGSSIYFIVKYEDIYAFELLLVAICIGGTSTILAPTFIKIFSLFVGPELYGITGISIGISNLLGPLSYEFISEQKYSFLIIFLIGTGLCIIKFIILIFFDENKRMYDIKNNEIQMSNIIPINDNDNDNNNDNPHNNNDNENDKN